MRTGKKILFCLVVPGVAVGGTIVVYQMEAVLQEAGWILIVRTEADLVENAVPVLDPFTQHLTAYATPIHKSSRRLASSPFVVSEKKQEFTATE